jgi:rare lipoprotein A
MLSLLVLPLIAACATNSSVPNVKRAAFTSKQFGVAVSPRATRMKNPPHGGGRNLSTKPYKVAGVTYTPVDGPGFVARGQASWYGNDFHGRYTANGEIFSATYITGASPVLPIPCYARVTNLENGRSVLVRFNDRGPYLQGRVADLSYQAAAILGYSNQGSANVQITYVAPAPLNGDDTRMLMASVDRPTSAERGDIRVAMAEPSRTPKDRNIASGGLIGDIITSLSYSDPTGGSDLVNGAVDAATAMATRADDLDGWKAVNDSDSLKVKLQLGTFQPAKADSIAQQFAMLGAVDEDDVIGAGGSTATRLTLTHLKPGVPRADAIALAQKLGLTDVVLY